MDCMSHVDWTTYFSRGCHQGRFGRMFRALPPYCPRDELIAMLALAMREEDEAAGNAGWGTVQQPSRFEHPGGLPAGYTYLGQFLDHDLTFDPTSQLNRETDPDTLHNFRTPRFDLDSVYGRGPHDQPYLYDGLELAYGRDDSPPDLLRRHANDGSRTRALIGDPKRRERDHLSASTRVHQGA
jgi:hypothetical protein